MSIGPGPGTTVKATCSSKTENSAAFGGDDVSISMAASKETVEYFTVGQQYVIHFRPVGADGPDTESPSQPGSTAPTS